MSLESLKRRLLDAASFAAEPIRAFAVSLLGELETAEERERRLARERQQKRRRDQKGGPEPPPRLPDPEPPNVTPERDRSVTDRSGDVTPVSRQSVTERDSSVTSVRVLARTQDPDLSSESLRIQDSHGSVSLKDHPRARVEPVTLSRSAPQPASVTRIRDRGSRVPPSDATQTEVEAWCRQWKIDHTHPGFAEFLDFWRGVPGEKGRKSDWASTWRNRLRQLEERGSGVVRAMGSHPAKKGKTPWDRKL